MNHDYQSKIILAKKVIVNLYRIQKLNSIYIKRAQTIYKHLC